MVYLIAFLYLALLLFAIFVFVVLPVIFWAWQAAKNNKQATFLPESTIAFVMAGGTVVKALVNIRGKRIEEAEEVEEDDPERRQLYRKILDDVPPKTFWRKIAKNRGLFWLSWLEPGGFWKWLKVRWGFFWISIFYPARKIHEFKIQKSRLRKKGEIGRETALRDQVEYDSEPTQVHYLRWRFPRFYVIEDIPCSDKIRVDCRIYTAWEVIYPYIPVFVWEGKFFDLLESAIRSQVLKWAVSKTSEAFLQADKGPGSEFTKFLLKINNTSVTYTENGEEHDAQQGVVREFGLKLIDTYADDARISEEDSEALEAQQAKEIARLRGDARVVEAEREAAAIRTVGAAEADVIQAKGKAEKDSIERRYGAAARKGGTTGVRGAAIEAATRNLAGAPNIRTLSVGGPVIGNIPLVEGDEPSSTPPPTAAPPPASSTPPPTPPPASP